ncbi:hypothetical protein H9L25_00370 [Terrisporobacter mayombei]|nr:hypothetical protein [Terrisporobacter mayombei]
MREKVLIKDNIYDKEIHKPINYTFENVFKLKEHEWSTHIDAETLAELWESQKILYFPESQRGLTLKRNKSGVLEEKAVFSARNIKSIQNKIAKGEYHPDQITLNLLSDGSDTIVYENNTLEVESLITVLDGQHRLKALSNIYQANKMKGDDEKVELKSLIFPVKITNYDKDAAAQQFYQYTLGLKISKSLAESFNKKNSINRIVGELSRNGVLKGRIDATNTSIKNNNIVNLTTFATMVSAITDSFGEITDATMEKDVLDFLQIFFKELTSVFPEMLNDTERHRSKQVNLICENFMMYAYIEIAQLLYCMRFQSDSWKDQLWKMSNIDFDKINHLADKTELNPIWSPILRLGSEGQVYITNNKTTRQSLRRIIKEQFYLAQSK